MGTGVRNRGTTLFLFPFWLGCGDYMRGGGFELAASGTASGVPNGTAV